MSSLGHRWKLKKPRKPGAGGWNRGLTYKLTTPRKPRVQTTSLMDRFMAKVSPEPNSGCWLWMGSCDWGGRAKFRSPDSTVAAHAAYTLFCGIIPDGVQVLHRCDMPACVNPDHLFLGTLQDNMADRNAKKRHAHGERHGKAKLTEADVRAIRASTENDVVLAKRYGRGVSTIHAARSGRHYWKHLK